MHPRVCLHQVAFAQHSTADFIAYCEETGIAHMTLATPMLARDGLASVRASLEETSGTGVAIVNHPVAMTSNLEQASAASASSELGDAIETAATLGAQAIYLVSGGRGSLSWEAAAERFAAIVGACKAKASAAGVTLLVEPAMGFNSDIHIAHTFDDTVRLAELAGIGVCIDLQQVWFESDLEARIASAVPRAGLVQVSDYVYGDKCTPCRAVPGDGAIPLERLVGAALEAGYEGLFDLELVGPRIESEGPRSACRRAAENLSEMLERLGA